MGSSVLPEKSESTSLTVFTTSTKKAGFGSPTRSSGPEHPTSDWKDRGIPQTSGGRYGVLKNRTVIRNEKTPEKPWWKPLGFRPGVKKENRGRRM